MVVKNISDVFLIHKRLMDVILTRTDVPRTKLKYTLIYDFFVNHANLFEIPWPTCCFGLAQLVLAFFLLGIDCRPLRLRRIANSQSSGLARFTGFQQSSGPDATCRGKDVRFPSVSNR